MICWTTNMHKRPQAKKNRFSWAWNLKNLKIRFQKLKNVKKMEPVLLKILCRLDYTLLQTSSRVQNNEKPIWVEIQKHCKNAVTI